MPALMPYFYDLADGPRWHFRDSVEAAGGSVEGYDGVYMIVALPNPAGPFFTAMDSVGLELEESSLHYFPLGTDNPPDSLRHDGRYPGSRGFWQFGRYRPKIAPPAPGEVWQFGADGPRFRVHSLHRGGVSVETIGDRPGSPKAAFNYSLFDGIQLRRIGTAGREPSPGFYATQANAATGQ